MTTTTENYKTVIKEYNTLLSRPMPDVQGLNRKDFRPCHRTLWAIKQRAPDWVAASRKFGVAQFGEAFVRETEAQMAAETEVAKQGRIAARAAKQAQAKEAAASNE